MNEDSGPAGSVPVDERAAAERAPAADEVAAAIPPAAAPTTPPAEAPRSAAPGKPRRPPRSPMLLRAFRTGRPVRGTIVQVIKGGYEVKLERARGFCPHSQVELSREDNPERQVGKSYLFRVTEVRRGGEDAVLSRRAILEEERAEEAKAVRATLVRGSIMRGRVASIAEFGAFIDLGAGVMGLAHVSELSHRRIENVADAVQIGASVQVKVLKISEKTGRVSLSLRQAEADPWADVDQRFRPGVAYPGVIRRIADFGAFVELAPGVEALAPASEFPPASAGWSAGLAIDDQREWLVLAVDGRARRISLVLQAEAGSAVAIEPALEIAGLIQRIQGSGVFVWLAPGRVGFLPRESAGLPPDLDLRRRYRIGDKLDVRVVDVGEGGRPIRLARKGVEIRAQEPAKAERPLPRPAPPKPAEPASTFGTVLGEKLRAALGDKKPPS